MKENIEALAALKPEEILKMSRALCAMGTVDSTTQRHVISLMELYGVELESQDTIRGLLTEEIFKLSEMAEVIKQEFTS